MRPTITPRRPPDLTGSRTVDRPCLEPGLHLCTGPKPVRRQASGLMRTPQLFSRPHAPRFRLEPLSSSIWAFHVLMKVRMARLKQLKQVRTFEVTIADGNGNTKEMVAAESGAAARVVVEGSLTKHQALKEIKHKGFRAFRAQPDDDETGVVFVSADDHSNGKPPLRFDVNDRSQRYLQTALPKQMRGIEEYYRQKDWDGQAG